MEKGWTVVCGLYQCVVCPTNIVIYNTNIVSFNQYNLQVPNAMLKQPKYEYLIFTSNTNFFS